MHEFFFRFPDERTGSPAELAVDVNGRCMGFRADQPNMIQPSKNNGTKFAFAIADIGVNIFGRGRHLIAKKSRFASLAEQTRFLEILADGFKAFPLPMPDGSKGGAGILLTPDCMEHMKSGDFVNGGLLEQLRYSEYWLKFKNTKIARFWLRS